MKTAAGGFQATQSATTFLWSASARLSAQSLVAALGERGQDSYERGQDSYARRLGESAGGYAMRVPFAAGSLVSPVAHVERGRWYTVHVVQRRLLLPPVSSRVPAARGVAVAGAAFTLRARRALGVSGVGSR